MIRSGIVLAVDTTGDEQAHADGQPDDADAQVADRAGTLARESPERS